MRDLGGFVNKDGIVTKFNRFIRSNIPVNLEDEEIDYLKQIGITTVIDLRSEREVNRVKSGLNIELFDYYNVNINKNRYFMVDEDPIKSYMLIFENKDMLYKIFKIIVESEGGVLYHCTAGKDRTGIISMLLFLIADVYEDDIIADYQVSYTYLRKIIRKMQADDPSLPAYLGYSNMETMESVLELFHNKYNNVYDYLINIGITDLEFNMIRDKLLK